MPTRTSGQKYGVTVALCRKIARRRFITLLSPLFLLVIPLLIWLKRTNDSLLERRVSDKPPTTKGLENQEISLDLDHATKKISRQKQKSQQPNNGKVTNKTIVFEKLKHIEDDFMTGGYLNFYNDMLEQRLSVDLYLSDLQSSPLSLTQRLERVCTFIIENNVRRREVAIGYDCLLQLLMKGDENKSHLDIFKAIKYGSLSLATFYTQAAAINLMRAIIFHYEEALVALGDITHYYTGYRVDEEKFLEEVLKLNHSALSQRVMIRQSFIHLHGGSSSIETSRQYDFPLAVDLLNNIRSTTKIKQNNILDVALTVSEEYIIGAATCVVSALVNSDFNSYYRFHVIMESKNSISMEWQQKLASFTYIRDYSIKFLVFPEDAISSIVKQRMKNRQNFITVYRLFFDKIFPELDIVLHIDVDTIVQTDLNAFKKIDMTDYIWAAAPAEHYRHDQPQCNGRLPHFYINSGVLFVNLTNSRRAQIYDRMDEYVLQVDECFGDEQDLINTIFADYIYYLPHRWNAMVTPLTQRFYFSSFVSRYISKKPSNVNFEYTGENDFDAFPDFKQNWNSYRELAGL